MGSIESFEKLVPLVLGALGFLFGVYQWKRNQKLEAKSRKQDAYRVILTEFGRMDTLLLRGYLKTSPIKAKALHDKEREEILESELKLASLRKKFESIEIEIKVQSDPTLNLTDTEKKVFKQGLSESKKEFLQLEKELETLSTEFEARTLAFREATKGIQNPFEDVRPELMLILQSFLTKIDYKLNASKEVLNHLEKLKMLLVSLIAMIDSEDDQTGFNKEFSKLMSLRVEIEAKIMKELD